MTTEAERIKRRKYCERCGHCCIKGGPTLHKQDLPLFEQGTLGYTQVYTLRKGEMVSEQVKGGLMPLDEEIVKLRGLGTGWMCLFYDDDANACTIYDDRPAECSAFNCWATEELEEMYEKNRISRFDIIPEDSALAEVIKAHEEEISYDKISEMAFAFVDGDTAAGEKLAERVTYDAAFRSAFSEKTEVGAEEMNFFFGRPLYLVLKQYDLEVAKDGDKYIVRKIEE